MREYVRGLEAQLDEPILDSDSHTAGGEIPSGDDLAEAFEEYLREQGLE